MAFAPLSPRDAEALLASLGSQDGGAREAAPSAAAVPAIRRWGSIKSLFRLGDGRGTGLEPRAGANADRGAPRPGGPAGGRVSHKLLSFGGVRAGDDGSEQGRVARALAASRGSARSEAARRDGAAAEDAARSAAAEQAWAAHHGAAWLLRRRAVAAVQCPQERCMRVHGRHDVTRVLRSPGSTATKHMQTCLPPMH